MQQARRREELILTFPNRHAHYLHTVKEHFQTGYGTVLRQPPLFV